MDDSETYITEQELRRIWVDTSSHPMGKHADKFNVEEALLLLGDVDYEQFMAEDADSTTTAFVQNAISESPILQINKPNSDEIIDDGEEELIITLQVK